MDSPSELPPVPCTPTQQRLLRVARYTWSIPLRLATLILLVFLLTDSMLLAGFGLIVLELGGLFAVAGIILCLMVATQRRQSKVSSDDPCQKTAFQTLGLLLSNFAVAGLYAYIGIAQIGTSISAQASSPSDTYMAEVSILGEDGTPPYGQAVSLRPAANPFKFLTRAHVFNAHCDSLSALKWIDDQTLEIHCINPQQVTLQETRYQDVVVRYPPQAPAMEKKVRKGRL